MPRRTDGLYQRSGRPQFFFKFKADDGTWKEKATGIDGYNKARKFRTAFLLELEQGRVPNERAKWTLKQATDDWLTERKPRISAPSYASERSITKNLLRVLKPETRLRQLAEIGRVKGYENFRLKEGISEKTINNETVVLAGILKRAKLWYHIEEDYKRLPVRDSDIGDALTVEEGRRLLQVARLAHVDAVSAYAAVYVRPIWTPDGQHITYGHFEKAGVGNLYWTRTDGAGTPLRLTAINGRPIPSSWHPAGKVLAFNEGVWARGVSTYTITIEGNDNEG